METTTFLAEIWQCLPTWLLAIFLLSGLLLPFVSDFKKWRDPDRVYRFLQILAGSWYIILCNLIFWVLLGGMQVGNDTLNYLVQKHNTAGNPLSPWDFWATAAAVQVSVMLFAAVAWITPQNNMSGDQLAIYSQNPARTVYRVL
ncbi:MAG: hypothetical protein ABIQ93_08020, partial [Saprospiraceae bacterium]